MVSLENELGPEEEDLVEPYEEDVHNMVVRLVFSSPEVEGSLGSR